MEQKTQVLISYNNSGTELSLAQELAKYLHTSDLATVKLSGYNEVFASSDKNTYQWLIVIHSQRAGEKSPIYQVVYDDLTQVVERRMRGVLLVTTNNAAPVPKQWETIQAYEAGNQEELQRAFGGITRAMKRVKVPSREPKPNFWSNLSLPMRVGLVLVLILLLLGGGVFTSLGFTSYNHALSVSTTATAQAQATAAFIKPAQDLFNTTTAKKPVVQGFQNNKLQWETGPKGCDLVNDTYHASIIIPGFYRTCMAAKSNFKNFAYQVTLAIPDGNAGGVIFRDDAKGNYYRAWITNTSDGPSNFFVSYCDSVTFICQDFQTGDGNPLTSSKVTLHPGSLVTLTVIAKDSNINLYVNGQLSISLVVDGNHKVGQIPPIAGQIGFYAASVNQQDPVTDVAFTNLRVWQLD